MKKIMDEAYGKDKSNLLDIYLPDTKGFKTIIYFHGGGLVNGDKNNADVIEFAKEFVKNGYGFVSVEYRLYSQGARFPDFINDCADAVAYLITRISSLGGNGEFFICGQSAGAWISLMLCLDEKYLLSRNVDKQKIVGWIIESGQTTSHFNVIKYELGEDERRQLINEYAPLYYVNEKTNFSKMLLFTYENDMPCRPEQNELFVKAVKVYCPSAKITQVRLKGEHVHGSTHKNEDGTYDFMNTTLQWLKEDN